jgi:glucokinase
MAGTKLIIAGDVGGTKTHLGIYEVDGHGPNLRALSGRIYDSRVFRGLDAICVDFMRDLPRPDAACFGIPGPIIRGVSHATNLPWEVEENALAETIGVRRLKLVNDLQATALGVPHLAADETVVLQKGESIPGGNIAVIAAGTGLGEAGLIAGESGYTAIASEGGHCDFAPRGEEQTKLMMFLADQFGHASVERALSGPGLFNIYRFLKRYMEQPEPEWLSERLAHEDPAAVINEVGSAGADLRCARAVEMFIAIYGAEASNLALKFMALGGVFIGGGIAPKMLASLNGGGFIRAFNDKGRLGELLRRIEVRVILNQATALLGAAWTAARLL